jgi:glycolate oxidase iron-sulfur subunit
VLARPRLFATALGAGRAVRALLPRSLRMRIPVASRQALAAPSTGNSRRVVLLEGCVQPGLAPDINAAAARVLDRVGIAAQRLAGERCCGALAHHLDRKEHALAQARANVEAASAALDAGADAIVSTASACGLMVRDYGRLLAGDPAFAQRAARVSSATRDIAELIEPGDLERLCPAAGSGPRVALQTPCTLQHGQRITGRIEALLTAAGFVVTPTSEATLCCGSAGTYSILQPELSSELRRRKLAALAGGNPQLIATANIGCLEHLRVASPVPVRHWIELVAEALDREPRDR